MQILLAKLWYVLEKSILWNKGFNTSAFWSGWHHRHFPCKITRTEWKEFASHIVVYYSFLFHYCFKWAREKKRNRDTGMRNKEIPCCGLLMYKTYRYMRLIKIYPKLLIVTEKKKKPIPLRLEWHTTEEHFANDIDLIKFFALLFRENCVCVDNIIED